MRRNHLKLKGLKIAAMEEVVVAGLKGWIRIEQVAKVEETFQGESIRVQEGDNL